MIKTCGFKVLDRFINKDVWLSLKSMECVLRDAGYDVHACQVFDVIENTQVNIGFSREHYFIIGDRGYYPDIMFLTGDEMLLYSCRVLTEEELERTKGGKGGMTLSTPAPPPQPSTGDAIKEWVESMPQVYETQLEYAPKEAAQQVALAQEYAQPMAAAYKTAQETLYPETTALQEQMAGQAALGMSQGLTQPEKEQYRSDISANLGLNIGSPIGAEYMSRNMLMAQQKRQDYFRNIGLSLAGRQPMAQPQMPQTSNYMGQFGPQQPMNMAAGTYGAYTAASRPFAHTSKGGLMGWLGF